MNEITGRRAEDAIVQLCKVKHSDLDRRLEAVEEAMIRIAQRPPIWASSIIALLCACIGFLVK